MLNDLLKRLETLQEEMDGIREELVSTIKESFDLETLKVEESALQTSKKYGKEVGGDDEEEQQDEEDQQDEAMTALNELVKKYPQLKEKLSFGDDSEEEQQEEKQNLPSVIDIRGMIDDLPDAEKYQTGENYDGDISHRIPLNIFQKATGINPKDFDKINDNGDSYDPMISLNGNMVEIMASENEEEQQDEEEGDEDPAVKADTEAGSDEEGEEAADDTESGDEGEEEGEVPDEASETDAAPEKASGEGVTEDDEGDEEEESDEKEANDEEESDEGDSNEDEEEAEEQQEEDEASNEQDVEKKNSEVNKEESEKPSDFKSLKVGDKFKLPKIDNQTFVKLSEKEYGPDNPDPKAQQKGKSVIMNPQSKVVSVPKADEIPAAKTPASPASTPGDSGEKKNAGSQTSQDTKDVTSDKAAKPVLEETGGKKKERKQLVDLTGEATKKGITKADVDADELSKGKRVEMEHTKDGALAEKIALDHLSEIPDYYTRLERMEREAKGSGDVTKQEKAEKSQEEPEEAPEGKAPKAKKEPEPEPESEPEEAPADEPEAEEQPKEKKQLRESTLDNLVNSMIIGALENIEKTKEKKNG